MGNCGICMDMWHVVVSSFVGDDGWVSLDFCGLFFK